MGFNTNWQAFSKVINRVLEQQPPPWGSECTLDTQKSFLEEETFQTTSGGQAATLQNDWIYDWRMDTVSMRLRGTQGTRCASWDPQEQTALGRAVAGDECAGRHAPPEGRGAVPRSLQGPAPAKHLLIKRSLSLLLILDLNASNILK